MARLHESDRVSLVMTMEERILAAVPGQGAIGYTALWVAVLGRDKVSAEDVGRFSSALERLRQNYHIDIRSKKGCTLISRSPILPGLTI